MSALKYELRHCAIMHTQYLLLNEKQKHKLQ